MLHIRFIIYQTEISQNRTIKVTRHITKEKISNLASSLIKWISIRGGGKRSTAKKKDRNKVGSIVPNSGRPLSAPPSFARHKRTRVTIIVGLVVTKLVTSIHVIRLGLEFSRLAPWERYPRHLRFVRLTRVSVSRASNILAALFLFLFLFLPLSSPLSLYLLIL